MIQPWLKDYLAYVAKKHRMSFSKFVRLLLCKQIARDEKENGLRVSSYNDVYVKAKNHIERKGWKDGKINSNDF